MHARERSRPFSKGPILMRKVTRAALALAGSAALIGVTTVPSFATQHTGTTPTTVTITAGVLEMTVPTGATLVTAAPGATSTTVLPETTVADKRAGTANWNATVSLPLLTGIVLTTETIPTSGATYKAATVTPTGTATLAIPATLTDLTTVTPQISQAATAVNGNNTATWTATLTVPIPTDVLADTYSGTLTQSVT